MTHTNSHPVPAPSSDNDMVEIGFSSNANVVESSFISTPFDESKKEKSTATVTAIDQGIEASIDSESQKEGEQHEPNAKWYHASFHVVCCMVGTGVLALPKAMAQLTWIPGMILLVVAFAVTFYAAYLVGFLAQGPNGERPSSYVLMCKLIIGIKKTQWLVMPFLYVAVVGTCIAYLITAGENINSIYTENCTNCTSVRQLVWTSCIAAIELLLALFPSLETFTFVSLLGAVMSVGYTVIAVVLNCTMAGKIPYDASYGLDGSALDGVMGVFMGLTTIVFAFNFTFVQPDIQSTLADKPGTKLPPRKAMVRATTVAYVMVAFMYFGSAISGYYAFGNAVQGDVLLSISQYVSTSAERGAITAAQVMVIIHVTVAFQMFAMVVYQALERGYAKWRAAPCPRLVRYLMRWSFVVLTWFVAIAIPFFSDIMSLLGAIAYVPLCFVIPCSLYLVFCRAQNKPVHVAEKTLIGAIIVLAVIVGIVGAIASVRQIILDAGTFTLFK